MAREDYYNNAKVGELYLESCVARLPRPRFGHNVAFGTQLRGQTGAYVRRVRVTEKPGTPLPGSGVDQVKNKAALQPICRNRF